MQRTNIYLEARQLLLLDQLAAERRLSRAELIRRLLDEALAGEADNAATGLAAVRESFGVLRDAGIDLPVRAEDSRERHLKRMWELTD